MTFKQSYDIQEYIQRHTSPNMSQLQLVLIKSFSNVIF